MLGERERVPAVGEEGPVARAKVHVARVELGEVGDEEGRRVVLAGGEALDPRDELTVGEVTERAEDVVGHGPFYHRGGTGQVRAAPPGSYGPGAQSLTVGSPSRPANRWAVKVTAQTAAGTQGRSSVPASRRRRLEARRAATPPAAPTA